MIAAVLDTNALVSAAIKADGIPAQLLALAEESYILLTSEYILEETMGVLARKHIQKKYKQRVSAARRQGFLTELKSAAVLVNVETTLTAVSEDVKDNPILACAFDGGADYLVTGDRHLLALEAYDGIQIVTPAAFLAILGGE